MKVLFICKKRASYTVDDDDGKDSKSEIVSSGLYNSALLVCRMLQANGVESDIVQVVDNNNIDREVTKYRPTHVVIEALWVVPSKFEILKRLHPDVAWIIRIHSEIPFLANEGIAIEWIRMYLQIPKVYVAANSWHIYKELKKFDTGHKQMLYLPNYYPLDLPIPGRQTFDPSKGVIKVGCFGAIRPMKNQLIQAVAAVRLADSLGVDLQFHVNTTRIEMKGNSILRNLRALFNDSPTATLVEHDWYGHERFLDVVSQMDLGMQFSFSESFNIVTADFVNMGVPVVTSFEVRWLPRVCKGRPTSVESIVGASKRVLFLEGLGLPRVCRCYLDRYSRTAMGVWLQAFKGPGTNGKH